MFFPFFPSLSEPLFLFFSFSPSPSEPLSLSILRAVPGLFFCKYSHMIKKKGENKRIYSSIEDAGYVVNQKDTYVVV